MTGTIDGEAEADLAGKETTSCARGAHEISATQNDLHDTRSEVDYGVVQPNVGELEGPEEREGREINLRVCAAGRHGQEERDMGDGDMGGRGGDRGCASVAGGSAKLGTATVSSHRGDGRESEGFPLPVRNPPSKVLLVPVSFLRPRPF